MTGPLELPLPIRPLRTLLLKAGAVRNARIALEVDGRLIPEEIFGQHQIMKGRPAAVHDGQDVPVGEIAGEDIVVLVGPPTNVVPPNAPASNDLSSVPQFRATFRRIRAVGPTVLLSD